MEAAEWKKVPEDIANTQHFKQWLAAQEAAGNRLDGVKPVFTFYVANGKFLLYWGMQARVWVESEERYKDNEIVISRPDIKHVVALHKAENFLDSKIVIVREFRSTSSTKDGFIREIPGGSGFKPQNPADDAVKEFAEETGILIEAQRLSVLGARQVAGTATTHKGHCFLLELTDDEIQNIENRQEKSYGNKEESEQTHVEIHTVQDLLNDPMTDWANLGMIFAALNK